MQQARAGETVLLVEDDPALNQILKEFLIDLGYRVLATQSSILAVEILGGPEPIDLLLADVVLPDVNGADLAVVAKELRPLLPVLFMSGYGDQALEHYGAVVEGGDLVRKPFFATTLAEAVRRALDQLTAGR